MKTKGKLIFDAVFLGLSLLPLVWLVWASVDLYLAALNSPDPGDIGTKAWVFVLVIYAVIAAFPLAANLLLHSALNELIFTQGKDVFGNVLAVVKILLALVVFVAVAVIGLFYFG